MEYSTALYIVESSILLIVTYLFDDRLSIGIVPVVFPLKSTHQKRLTRHVQPPAALLFTFTTNRAALRLLL